MGKGRQSNFELLRILSMAFIISFHYVLKGGFNFEGGGGTLTVNKFIWDILYHFGELGVNCFILITGYFLPHSRFGLKKLVLLVCQTEFYLIFCRAVLVLLGQAEWTSWTLKDYLFPILRPQYWFVSVYVLIYLLGPYLQKLVQAMNQQEFARLLLIQLGVWSVYPTVVQGLLYQNGNTEGMTYYSRFVWLIVMTLLGAYIRLYGLPFLANLKRSILCTLASFGAIVLFVLGVELGILTFPGIGPVYFWPPNAVLLVLLSVGLFGVFVHLPVPAVGWVNYTASCTLGIYMLHDGSLQAFWWRQVFRNATHQDSRFFLIHIGIATGLILLLGTGIDSGRKVLEEGISRLWDKLTAGKGKIPSSSR